MDGMGGDIEVKAVRGRVEIHAAVGRAAVVLHLEGQVDVGGGGGGGGVVDQPARGDVGDADHLARAHRDAVVGQGPEVGQGVELDRQQVVAVGVGEAEVG